MDGFMEETVKEAIFITVPLNRDAARGPAEQGGVSQAATHAGGGGCLYMCQSQFDDSMINEQQDVCGCASCTHICGSFLREPPARLPACVDKLICRQPHFAIL